VHGEPPLTGVRILDLSRVVAGPYCTQILSDLGADVWKIEHPDRGDDTRAWGPVMAGDQSAYFLAVNRGKRSLGVDLKSEAGAALIRDLAEHADLVVENFLPGKLESMGLGFDALRARNPRLCLLSITAFGQSGPLADEPGYDLVVQGYGGVMAVTGPTDGAPHRVGLPIVDLSAGIYAATAALAGLRAAERDGVGQRIDVSLFACHLAWLANVGSNALVSGEPTPRYGNAHANVAPYEPVEADDGWMLLAVGNDRQWGRLLGLPGFGGLAQPQWATNDGRVGDRDALIEALAPILRERSRAEWLTDFKAARVPCGPILRPDEALAHPQTAALGMVHRVQHPSAGPLSLVGSPLGFSGTPVAAVTPPPRLGEGGDGLLRDILKLDDDALAGLRSRGAIR